MTTTTLGYKDSSCNTATAKEKDVVWYIKEICGGLDCHVFDDYKEAANFGQVVRQNCPELDVEINYVTVRL